MTAPCPRTCPRSPHEKVSVGQQGGRGEPNPGLTRRGDGRNRDEHPIGPVSQRMIAAASRRGAAPRGRRRPGGPGPPGATRAAGRSPGRCRAPQSRRGPRQEAPRDRGNEVAAGLAVAPAVEQHARRVGQAAGAHAVDRQLVAVVQVEPLGGEERDALRSRGRTRREHADAMADLRPAAAGSAQRHDAVVGGDLCPRRVDAVLKERPSVG